MNRAQKILKDAERILKSEHMVSLRLATGVMTDSAIAKATLLSISGDWAKSQQKLEKGRRAAYISAEYLTGRAIGNNLYALGVLDDIKQLLSEKGVDPSVLEDEEDAALGNGGLGRLAACFLDSAATHDLPLSGYGLKYRYGLFKQKIENNSQVEVPDDWEMYSDNWTVRRDELSVLVELADGAVKAVPYDMPVIGYGTNNVGTLRLWQTESLKEFDFALFNDYKYAEACADKNKAEDIVKVLYPNDWNIEGKRLRLKQEYVLSSASMQDILRSYEKTHRSYGKLAEYVAVQLNDTHPVLAIPELIRLLMKKGVSFTTACNYAKQVFAFTNHTVMPEALEKWDMELVASVNREIAAILKRLHRKSLRECGIGLIRDSSVSMADTAVFMSFAVNGVAKIHSELVKTALFPEWYKLSPAKFHNKTNGVTQRRWLGLCNPELEQLLRKYAKADFIKDLSALDGIRPTQAMAEELRQVKQRKKQQLSDYLLKTQGVSIPSDFVFDIQIKRLHEYKRQLMNALGIYDLYLDIKAGKLKDLPPVAFIFGAKAAPGYARAKAVIRYINELANVINNDPDVNDRLRVCFVANYNCSVAEKLIPAADFSEQISPAGTEASGTGNMKLMMNGAVTIGTWDGANIEIAQAADEENEIVFGARLEELETIKDSYDPKEIYEADKHVRRAVDSLSDGGSDTQEGTLNELRASLLVGASWHKPDHYYVLKDFASYREARIKAYRLYANQREKFDRMCLKNVLASGVFSSDRTVKQYAEEIWKIK